MTANADRYWAQYLASLAADRRPASPYVESFSFGFTPEDGREIAPLVLSGTKTATGSVFWSYEADKKRLPEVGDQCIVTAGYDDPVCVIETTQVRVIQFDGGEPSPKAPLVMERFRVVYQEAPRSDRAQ